MEKQQKYHTKKYANDRAKSKMTTIRLDKITEENLKELQHHSGLSQSQIVRKLINSEHILQSNFRVELFGIRDKLNHLAQIETRKEDQQAIANIEQEYSTLKSKLLGGK